MIVPTAAEIVAIRPAIPAVASPEAFIVAAVVFEEVHVTVVVRSFVLLSLYVPVAWNCTVLPTVADEFVGVTTMDFRTTAVTVSEGAVEWMTDPLVPVIVIVYCPPGVLALVVIVSVEFPDPVIVAGAKVGTVPVGDPLAFKFTLLLKPFNEPTEMEYFAELPNGTVCEPGTAESEKSGDGLTGPTVKLQIDSEPVGEYKTQ